MYHRDVIVEVNIEISNVKYHTNQSAVEDVQTLWPKALRYGAVHD